MRCSRLPAVGRCGGVADDGHTITRTATITHGYALLAFGIWGAAAEKNGRRWGNYGGGVSVGFFGYHVFLLHPEVLSFWLLVFCAFDDVCA